MTKTTLIRVYPDDAAKIEKQKIIPMEPTAEVVKRLLKEAGL